MHRLINVLLCEVHGIKYVYNQLHINFTRNDFHLLHFKDGPLWIQHQFKRFFQDQASLTVSLFFVSYSVRNKEKGNSQACLISPRAVRCMTGKLIIFSFLFSSFFFLSFVFFLFSFFEWGGGGGGGEENKMYPCGHKLDEIMYYITLVND